MKLNETLKKISQIRFLLLSLIIVLTTAIIRTFYSTRTGFIAPDEAYYILALWGRFRYRPFFTNILWLYIQIGGINVFNMMRYGAYFGVIFGFGTILTLWKTLNFVSKNEKVNNMVVFSLALTPLFTIFSSTWLTETPALFFNQIGLLSLLYHFKTTKTKYAAVSGIFYLCGALIRANYWVFLSSNTVLILILSMKKYVSWKTLLIFAFCMFLTIPPQITSLNLSLQRIVPQFSSFEQPKIIENVPSSLDLPSKVEKDFSFFNVTEGFLLFLTGVFLGWNPVLAFLNLVAITLSFISVKKQASLTNIVLLVNSMTAYMAYLFHCLLTTFLQTTYAISSVIRFGHISLNSIPSLSKLYNLFSNRQKYVSLITTILVTASLLPLTSSLMQQHMLEKPLTFNYKTPYLKFYEKLERENESALLFAEPSRILSLFLVCLPNNVTLKGFVKEEDFHAIMLYSNMWEHVYIYAQKHLFFERTMQETRPFFSQLMRNQTRYKICYIWDTAESTLLEVIS